MKFKKFIALLCFIILCIQALPVRQLGAVLFNNQITEELSHADDAKKQGAEKESDHYLPAFYSCYFQEVGSTSNHTAQNNFNLVLLHIAEVQTPPPNLM